MQKEDDLADMIIKRGKQPETNTALWASLSRLTSYKNGGPISHGTLAANAGVFFAAGYETTAHTITWALFELAAQPDLQVNLVLKVRRLGGWASACTAKGDGFARCSTVSYSTMSHHGVLQARVQAELKAAGLMPTPANPTPRALEFAGWSCRFLLLSLLRIFISDPLTCQGSRPEAQNQTI